MADGLDKLSKDGSYPRGSFPGVHVVDSVAQFANRRIK